jgi:hypothetical protein
MRSSFLKGDDGPGLKMMGIIFLQYHMASLEPYKYHSYCNFELNV